MSEAKPLIEEPNEETDQVVDPVSVSAEKQEDVSDDEAESRTEADDGSKATGESLFAPLVSAVKRHPAYESTLKVLYWEDTVKSGLIFGIGNFFFFLITYGEYTIVTLVSYLLLALLLVCFGYSKFVTFRGGQNPFAERLKNIDFSISRETLTEHVECVYAAWEALRAISRKIFYCSDLALTGKAAASFWVMSVIGNWFSGVILLYSCFLVFFIWPRVYQEKKAEIDAAAQKVMAVVKTQLAVVLEKLPMDKILGKKKKKE
mmetsp:Transcript_19517/g.21703  ORF Transcript_19517/g.21703 Transcript_19517/m.21703 type:complete len:261 (+) Transcript_19517:43-825(+)|eukprot:CAMPEP_0168509466 /NCGR_PEP_ID=MMETSP0405-20121227/792_1 /TAXON_ID=498012 /ORGANISM="Trichosphaerium sp, Strain Am-I-7 wt" /LENGTH=260 /DNA_ID=CAMNT_0008526929 /DNA_START=23 /DNA_END=805 /DNA_ORIENTATION=+